MYDLYYLYFDGSDHCSCLVSDEVGKRIQECCVDRERFLDLGRKGSEAIEFYAIEQWDGYVLHEGNPYQEPQPPTLREFVENRGYDLSKDDSLRDYLIEFADPDPKNETELAEAIRATREKLDTPITDGELAYWMEWDYPMTESTQARAYASLVNLPLDDGERCGEEQLGSISFVEGDSPGSNEHYVIADSLAAIACLQYCLNELSSGIKINLLW